ncbi:MAG: pantoate--beta-alanine ligase [Desulfobacteraceae bacterium]|nr:pantoate--beta-alanine ligase [Desulfobacteraceae bacterium]
MRIIKEIQACQEHTNRIRLSGKTIAFVPTMGFLHQGHQTLLEEGRKRGDELILSIFVNPAQFGPNEDLEAYPRDFDRDLAVAEKARVDTIFFPDAKELYGDHYQTYVTLNDLPSHLCGLSRPDHFRGVATIVTKLFNIVQPHVALFGQKDYQQVAVIRQMVKDLNFNIEIVGVETVREPDGLAMSSRNTYLQEDQRPAALSLFQSLKMADNEIRKGKTNASEIITQAANLIRSFPENEIDYIKICHPDTLEDILTISGPVVMALAVKVGKTRLIDNRVYTP